MDNNN